ncbi:MAG: GNAT family N-acetyltransferase [Pseudomonadota bacterium]
MTLTVALDDPLKPELTALLRASHALMQSLFPAESNHFLRVEALAAPDIRFFSARGAETAIGCCALKLLRNYGEVKSMFVDPAARGSGAGAALLAAVETEARANALPLLLLETGSKLAAAHRLYARAGFVERGPFGDYREDPHSLFMEKALT